MLSENEKEIERMIWEYLDGSIGLEDKEEVRQKIAENAKWRELFEEVSRLQVALTQAELEMPSMRFSKNVMEKVQLTPFARPITQYVNKRIIFFISFLLIGIVTAGLFICLGQVNWKLNGSLISPEHANVEKLISTFRLSTNLVHIILMINVALFVWFIEEFLKYKRKGYAGWHAEN